MAATPSRSPPLVQAGDVRLLIHEAAFAAILKGMRAAKPWDFVFGSFDVPREKDQKDPIEIPTPNDGPVLKIHWRVDVTNVAIDLPPTDGSENGFPNPFPLRDGEAAVFGNVLVTLASEDLRSWRETVEISAWLRCVMQPISEGDLFFQLAEVQVRVPDITNSAVLNVVNHVLNAYLATAVPKYRIPIADALKSDMLTVSVTDAKLMLNAADFAGVISPPGNRNGHQSRAEPTRRRSFRSSHQAGARTLPGGRRGARAGLQGQGEVRTHGVS